MDAQALDGIYKEAIMFVSLFVSMYIFSFFMSRRNAKKFERDNPLEVRREKINKQMAHEKAMELRLAELIKLRDDGILSQLELNVLQNNLDNIVK